MTQPEGYVIPGRETEVCKLNKSLYRIRQASRIWNVKLNLVLIAAGIRQSNADLRAYFWIDKESTVIFAVWVDWLAAPQLKLRAKLNAFGKTAVMITYTSQNKILDIEMSSRGSLPRYKKFTINLDGWELVPLPPCNWTKEFVIFFNKPFGYHRNTWELTKQWYHYKS